MKLYRSFLLRCWRESGETPEIITAWRFLVMEITIVPQAPRGFADFQEVVTFIADEIKGESPDQGELPKKAADTPSKSHSGETQDEKGEDQ